MFIFTSGRFSSAHWRRDPSYCLTRPLPISSLKANQLAAVAAGDHVRLRINAERFRELPYLVGIGEVNGRFTADQKFGGQYPGAGNGPARITATTPSDLNDTCQ